MIEMDTLLALIVEAARKDYKIEINYNFYSVVFRARNYEVIYNSEEEEEISIKRLHSADDQYISSQQLQESIEFTSGILEFVRKLQAANKKITE